MQLKPIQVVVAVIAALALFAGVFYLGTQAAGGRASGPPPGMGEMKLSNENRSTTPPPAAAYVPPGAPAGVRQMIGQSRSGGVPVAPAPATYVPPGAPSGVKQMINQNHGSAAPGMTPPGQ